MVLGEVFFGHLCIPLKTRSGAVSSLPPTDRIATGVDISGAESGLDLETLGFALRRLTPVVGDASVASPPALSSLPVGPGLPGKPVLYSSRAGRLGQSLPGPFRSFSSAHSVLGLRWKPRVSSEQNALSAFEALEADQRVP